MPIYEYVCNACGERQEHIVKNDKAEVSCKKCGTDNMNRLFPTGTNFKLMGRGWSSGPQ